MNNYKVDDTDIRIINQMLERGTCEEVLDRLIMQLDCTRYMGHLRIVQTIDPRYARDVAIYNYILDKLPDDKKVNYRYKLDLRHKANLEFEEEHPPIIYDKKVSSRTPRRKKLSNETKPARKSKTKRKVNVEDYDYVTPEQLSRQVVFGGLVIQK